MVIFDPNGGDGMRDAARQADIAAAQAFGFGGSVWTAVDGSGTRTITAYVFRQEPGQLGITQPQAETLASIWRAIVVAGSVVSGTRVTSVDDPGYVFIIRSVEKWYDYWRCELTRKR